MKSPCSCLANCQAPTYVCRASTLEGGPVPRGPLACSQGTSGGPEFGLTSLALCPIKPQTWDLLSLLRLCMSLRFEALLMVLFSGFAFGATEAGASPKKDFASNLVELIASHSP